MASNNIRKSKTTLHKRNKNTLHSLASAAKTISSCKTHGNVIRLQQFTKASLSCCGGYCTVIKCHNNSFREIKHTSKAINIAR